MARKPSIPIVNFSDRTLNQAISAIKENIEIITGARNGIGEIAQLEPTATTAQIITKINEIITRLNVSST
ncbi:hypothetical protein UFOVP285_29 [uncultured Caudovirales phage]|uniref:Uncharacterized protein n=1 Tax=uncultured Caudovirales phage TaxID=2100421 RepID=A0A6J5LUR3_9CAUD|nr:hypothetical protein UFOVP285_29 [uncultured Caudovirales phage]